ncbi:uncharacterized protein LOC121415599 [Lytechinus variegatus]|uniref:uncharacterized protein LOC121415599 n=1 Tax=Lytechinus variegatus TaxID=7654 RepID=UPI001BB116EF|nr:uncharacterized protein LOC121415599 [Lytechinus variegatus]XP_041464926.1 uncharacterized protein LOC121415599 [Lytechinus variegatus]
MMESIKIKSNARKSTHSGKPNIASKEQSRIRQALKPELRSNHIPVKASPTTWKSSGWSLSARVLQKTNDELLTPMVITKDKERIPDAASNCDINSRSGHSRNVAGSDKKNPDQRSLWSLFSAPKVKENVDSDDQCQIGSVTNGCHRDDNNKVRGAEKVLSQDGRITKRESSEGDTTKKTSPPSFNLLSKMKPLKHASRNLFAQLARRPSDSSCQDLYSENTQHDPSKEATKQPNSRIGHRTADLPGNEPPDIRIQRPESRRNHEQNTNIIRLTERTRTRDRIENPVTVKHSSVEESDISKADNRRESAHFNDSELVSLIPNQDKDCSLVEKDAYDTSSPTKDKDGSSEDLPMPTLTLPPEIEHRNTTSNVSSEHDESDCLFIDEQVQPNSPQNERGSGVGHEEESHVLRVWSLQSDVETSSDFHNVDLSSSFSDSCSTGMEDSLLSTSASLNSSALSFIENGARSVEGFHERENSNDLSKSASEKTLEATRDTHKNKNHISRREGFEEGPPKLQAQPNTHHLLQELDSLLECSAFHGESCSNVLVESTEDLNKEHETSGDLNLQSEKSEQSNIQLEVTNNSNVQAEGEEPSNVLIEENNELNVQAEEKELTNAQVEGKDPSNLQIEKSELTNVPAEERDSSNVQLERNSDSNTHGQAFQRELSNVQAEEKEASTLQNEASNNSNVQAEEKEPSNVHLEALEEESSTDSLIQSKESDHENATESARNIFSLFSSAKRPLPPTNIVKLQFDRNPYSTSVHSDISQNSPVQSDSCSSEKNQSIRTNHPADDSASTESNNKATDVGPVSLMSNVLLNSPVSNSCVEKSNDHSPPSLSNEQLPSPLMLTSITEPDTGKQQNDEHHGVSQPPEFCLEVNQSSVGGMELSLPSASLPTPEEDVVDDIPFLSFKSRDDLVSYSKAVKLKVQKKSTQSNKVPAKKFVYPVVKNVKMKKRKKLSPIEAKIQALEKDLLWSMECKGLTEIVHPVLSRKGVALEKVRKNDLVVEVRNEELDRTHKRVKHKKRHRSKSESEQASNFRGIGSNSNSIKLSGSRHSQYNSNLHVRNSKGDKFETEHKEKPSDKVKVVGLKHGHFPGLQKTISKVQSAERSHREAQIKRSKPMHQEWAICQKELPATSEKPSLKLKLVTKAKANSTSPSKIEQSPLALSTKPRESTVPLKSPTSHIPVNVQQLHLPSSLAAAKSDVTAAVDPIEEHTQPVGDKSPPRSRLPEEESLPFKPFEKPNASKKSAFVSDALEDLLQGVDNKIKPLISPSTISVNSAKVVFKVPCRQNHSVKTLDMALKRQKPLYVASENYTSLTRKDSNHERKDKKKKKKKKEEKHKHKSKHGSKDGFVFGTGPDDLVRKLPKLPFENYGKSFSRPLFEKEYQDSNMVGEKSKGFLEVRNVLSVSGKVAVKRQSEEEMPSTKKIKQEPEESDESQNSADEIQQPILEMNPSCSAQHEPLPHESNTECKEPTREETQIQSETKIVKKCGEYCRLGCICECLNNSKTVQELSNHCRKVDCMLNCMCKKTQSMCVTGTRTRRPPSLSCDMLFYDDSYKFWRVGDTESATVETKKLQLLDHLPEFEKRNMMSTCARTRYFVTDKPEKWVKWKRRQLGITSSTKKRSSDLDDASQMALNSSNMGNQNPHQRMQISEVNQNESKQLNSKRTLLKEVADKANKTVEAKSNVSYIPATETTSKGTATYLQLSQQYLLNGKLMNLVALPNGNRILLPATCVPLKVLKETSTSSAPQSKLTNAQGGTSTTSDQLPIPQVKATMQFKEKHVPNILSNSSTKITSGQQKPVLPVQLHWTPSGIVLKSGIEEKTSNVAKAVRDGNSNVSQASISEIHPGIFRISNLPDQSQGPKVSGSFKKAESIVHINAAQQAVPAKTCSVNAKDKARTYVPLQNSSTKQDAACNVDKQAPLHKNLALSSPSASASNEKKEISSTSKPIGTMSKESQMSISKTFFMLDKSMYIMMMTDPEFEWTDKIEHEAKQGINKIFKSQAQNNCVLLSGDLELKLLIKGHQWARFHLRKRESGRHIGDVNESKNSLVKSTDGPNNADGCDSKAITSAHSVLKNSHKTVLVTAKTSVGDARNVTDVTSSIAETLPSKSNITPKVHESSPIILTGPELKQKCENVPVTTETNEKEGKKLIDATSNVCKLRSPQSNSTPETVGPSPVRSIHPDLEKPHEKVLSTEKMNIKEAQNGKDAISKLRGVMPEKSKISPEGHESNPVEESATSNTQGKISAMPDSTVENSMKLSSSLPEFEKLSEIVKRTSVDGVDESVSPVKIKNNAPDWLQDPKLPRPLEYQSYKGIKGPWFTTEKEGVKVVLQRKKDKRSPWNSLPQRTLKRHLTSPLPDVSAKKSPKCEKASFPNDNEDSDSSRGKGLNQEATSDGLHSVAEENIKEGETSKSEDKNYLCETTGLLENICPSNQVSSCTSIQDDLCKETSTNVDNILVNEKIVCDSPSKKGSKFVSSGLSEPPRAKSVQDANRSDGIDVERRMNSEDAEGTLDIEHFARFSEEDTSGPVEIDEIVSAPYKLPADDDDSSSVASLRIDESILEDSPNDDLIMGVPSPQKHVQESREDNPANLSATTSLDDLPHESDIKSRSSFSHTKDIVSMDSLQKKAQSTRTNSAVILPVIENEQENSVAVDSIPNQKLTGASPEVQDSDVPMASKVSAPSEPEQLSKDQAPLSKNVPKVTTPIKSTDVHPKKAPMLNIKFVATSNENCTTPICSSPVCPSPPCMSPVSDDIPENSQNTSPIPVKDSDNTDSFLSGTEIDVVNTDDDDDDEIDVETVLGVKPSIPNLNPYSSLREITSRLSSKLQEEQKRCPPPKKVKHTSPMKIKPHSPSKLSLQLSIGHRFGSPRHGQSKSLTYGPSKANLQHSSSTNENRKKKKKSKRKTPVRPSELYMVSYRDNTDKKKESSKEEEKTSEHTDGDRTYHHNRLERKRRDELRKTFQQLNTALHGSSSDVNKMPPKIHILNQAVEEVERLTEKEKALVREKELVKKHQRRLVYVHSNLLHHARCRGQIVFPEGSKLAESMDRIRSGLSKNKTSTSSESKIQESKVETTKPPTVKYLKLDSSTDSSANKVSISKRKKSKKKKLHPDKKSSSSTQKSTLKKPAPANETLVLKAKQKSVSYSPLTVGDLKKSSETKEQAKKDQGHSLSSVPSGSQQSIQNKYSLYGMDDDDSEEESLPIECYVSSSDEAEPEEDLMDYDEEEEYSDDGFIPASEDDEDTNDKGKEKGSSLEIRESSNVGSVVDLDNSSSSEEDFEDRMEAKSHTGLTGKKIPIKKSAPKVKELAPRIKPSLMESDDSDDDDLLIIAEENGITVEQSKGATTKENSKSQENSELLKGGESQGQAKNKELSKVGKDSGKFSSVPTKSQYTQISKPGNSSSQKTDFSSEGGMGEKTSKAPLVNVIDEIMNRLKGDTSAIGSEGKKANGAQRPTRAESDVSASNSADGRRDPEKLSSKPLTPGDQASTACVTDSIPSSAEIMKPIGVASSNHQVSYQSSTNPTTSVGLASNSYQAKAQLSLEKLNEHLNLLDSDSSDDEEDQESTLVLTPTVSKSLQPKEGSDLNVSRKQKEVTRQRICDELIADEKENDLKITSNLTSAVSNNIQPAGKNNESQSRKQQESPQTKDLLCEESSSDEAVNYQESTSALAALTVKHSQFREGKCTVTGKKEDNAQQTQVMVDISSSSSSSEESDDGIRSLNHRTASRNISVKEGHHEKVISHHVDFENVASTSYSKDSESLSSNQLQAEEKNSSITSQKKTCSIRAMGALADLISSVKTRVGNEDLVDSVDSDSEDSDSEDVSDGASGDDEESSDDDEDEMKSDKKGDDNVAEEDDRSNGSENKKQDLIDMEKDVAGKSQEESQQNESENKEQELTYNVKGGSGISQEKQPQSEAESNKKDLADLEDDLAGISQEESQQSEAENKKQDLTDIVKGGTCISQEECPGSEEPEGSPSDQSALQSANKVMRNIEDANPRAITSAEEPAKGSSITENGQTTQKQGESSSAEDSTNPIHDANPSGEENYESFSVGDTLTDDDAACLSFAAMGNDEDHEALFDAGDRSSPLSLDMDVASDDEIDDAMCDRGEDTTRSGLLPSKTLSQGGTSTDETNSRPLEISSRAEPSSLRGQPKPSSSFKDDLTLDEAISFLDIEKNSDGTLNVLLKGDYDDEKLDELFEKPGVMEYIITEASKKP